MNLGGKQPGNKPETLAEEKDISTALENSSISKLAALAGMIDVLKNPLKGLDERLDIKAKKYQELLSDHLTNIPLIEGKIKKIEEKKKNLREIIYTNRELSSAERSDLGKMVLVLEKEQSELVGSLHSKKASVRLTRQYLANDVYAEVWEAMKFVITEIKKGTLERMGMSEKIEEIVEALYRLVNGYEVKFNLESSVKIRLETSALKLAKEQGELMETMVKIPEDLVKKLESGKTAEVVDEKNTDSKNSQRIDTVPVNLVVPRNLSISDSYPTYRSSTPSFEQSRRPMKTIPIAGKIGQEDSSGGESRMKMDTFIGLGNPSQEDPSLSESRPKMNTYIGLGSLDGAKKKLTTPWDPLAEGINVTREDSAEAERVSAVEISEAERFLHEAARQSIVPRSLYLRAGVTPPAGAKITDSGLLLVGEESAENSLETPEQISDYVENCFSKITGNQMVSQGTDGIFAGINTPENTDEEPTSSTRLPMFDMEVVREEVKIEQPEEISVSTESPASSRKFAEIEAFKALSQQSTENAAVERQEINLMDGSKINVTAENAGEIFDQEIPQLEEVLEIENSKPPIIPVFTSKLAEQEEAEILAKPKKSWWQKAQDRVSQTVNKAWDIFNKKVEKTENGFWGQTQKLVRKNTKGVIVASVIVGAGSVGVMGHSINTLRQNKNDQVDTTQVAPTVINNTPKKTVDSKIDSVKQPIKEVTPEQRSREFAKILTESKSPLIQTILKDGQIKLGNSGVFDAMMSPFKGLANDKQKLEIARLETRINWAMGVFFNEHFGTHEAAQKTIKEHPEWKNYYSTAKNAQRMGWIDSNLTKAKFPESYALAMRILGDSSELNLDKNDRNSKLVGGNVFQAKLPGETLYLRKNTGKYHVVVESMLGIFDGKSADSTVKEAIINNLGRLPDNTSPDGAKHGLLNPVVTPDNLPIKVQMPVLDFGKAYSQETKTNLAFNLDTDEIDAGWDEVDLKMEKLSAERLAFEKSQSVEIKLDLSLTSAQEKAALIPAVADKLTEMYPLADRQTVIGLVKRFGFIGFKAVGSNGCYKAEFNANFLKILKPALEKSFVKKV